ncbi:MAG: NUDIX hydrolase [Lachnospiraceae bacterium]|nr:NUDIX hydrolase [Lachnospiraceae bacterium]
MGRDRSQALVVRGERILMVKHRMFGREFFCLPGGGIDPGETPAAAALRELKEEACLEGEIVQEINVFEKLRGKGSVYTYLIKVPEGAVAGKGSDPELPAGEQTIIGAEWMLLEEMSELDQIYLWASGLKAVPEFYARLNGMKK